MAEFLAMPGFYRFVFLILEPLSSLIAFFLVFLPGGTAAMYHSIVPSNTPAPVVLDARAEMAMCHLVGCYVLLAMISTFVLRTAKSALAHDPVAQERVVGSLLAALAIADVNHVVATSYAMPKEILFNPSSWNAITHGNISFVSFLFVARAAWFLGIGRKRFYFGQPRILEQRKKS